MPGLQNSKSQIPSNNLMPPQGGQAANQSKIKPSIQTTGSASGAPQIASSGDLHNRSIPMNYQQAGGM